VPWHTASIFLSLRKQKTAAIRQLFEFGPTRIEVITFGRRESDCLELKGRLRKQAGHLCHEMDAVKDDAPSGIQKKPTK
jgi:hypothetical protein